MLVLALMEVMVVQGPIVVLHPRLLRIIRDTVRAVTVAYRGVPPVPEHTLKTDRQRHLLAVTLSIMTLTATLPAMAEIPAVAAASLVSGAAALVD